MNFRQRAKAGIMLGLVVISASLVSAQGLPDVLPGIVRSRKAAVTARAMNNARQLGLALLEFENDYGQFPSTETAAKVADDTGKQIPLKPKTSHDLFQQLFASGIIAAPGVVFWENPNKKGEPDPAKSFAYVGGASITGNLERPLLVAPLATDGNTFDPKPFNGKAIVLRADGSCLSLPIDADGRVTVNDFDLLDPKQPYFGGKKAKIFLPTED